MANNKLDSTKAKKPKKSKTAAKIVISVIAALLLILAGSALGLVIYVAGDLPEWDAQQLSGAKTTFLYDDKGELITRLYAEENRTEVKLDKVPPDLIKAFVAVEDQDFYEHHGLNFKGIARALFYNIRSGDLTAQGASTITQQLARNAFLSFEKRWERKLKEMIIAFKLESTYSKDEILTMYMNKINFGAGAYGVQAAANTYFGKDVSQLTLAESALVAGLPQSPSAYNPFQYYDKAKTRQEIVLNSMVDCGFIDAAQAQAAKQESLVFKKATASNTRYGFYIDGVIEEAIDILETHELSSDPNNAVYRGGLKIYTAMNANIQQYAEELYTNPANFPQESKGGNMIQSAMALIDHHNGEIKTIIGGRTYERKRGFNRATSAYRQPGSAIKPLAVYAPALENGYMPYYIIDDAPVSFKSGNGVWTPNNYDGSYRGPIPMRTAVQYSVNIYAVRLLDQIGIRTSFDFAQALGLELVDSPGTNDLSLAPLSLGGLTHGVTPVQMATAYGTFANGGVYCKPHLITKIVNAEGIDIYNFKPEDKRAMTEETAWLMNNMLQTVCTSGTGTNARVPGVVTSGKTGTTEEHKDAWFCGFTPAYAVAVWMGYDSDHTMSNENGGAYPARLFRAVLQKAHENTQAQIRNTPTGVTSVTVCSLSGKRPSEKCPDEVIISDYCAKAFLPDEICDDLHQIIYICPESGKLAGKYCPNQEPFFPTRPDSTEPAEVPVELCNIHNQAPILDLNRNNYNPSTGGAVYICTDPRHEGIMYRALFAGALQSGGCSDNHIQKVELPAGTIIYDCPLAEHQFQNKTPLDMID